MIDAGGAAGRESRRDAKVRGKCDRLNLTSPFSGTGPALARLVLAPTGVATGGRGSYPAVGSATGDFPAGGEA